MKDDIDFGIDSGILQYVPKGAYYEDVNEQQEFFMNSWKKFFEYDRLLFSLSLILKGSDYSKAAMSHMLLSNPPSSAHKALVPNNLSKDYETIIIKYCLDNMSMSRALKALLTLTGKDKSFKAVNNARSRRTILRYIFDRPIDELENMAINYKQKLKKLISHALGHTTVWSILHFPEKKSLFNRWIGCWNTEAFTIFQFLFLKDFKILIIDPEVFPSINNYIKLKEAAKEANYDKFERLMNLLPMRVALGFRNKYKLNIPLSDIYLKSKMSDKENIQMQSATKKTGVKREINFKKHDIFELWKLFYHNMLSGDFDDLDKIMEAVDYVQQKMPKVDVGGATIILDVSHSMIGSDLRPLHPFLTSLSLIASMDNISKIIYVGGSWKKVPVDSEREFKVVVPGNGTYLWKGLLEAMKNNPKDIILISDGYENSIKGMFGHVYKHLKRCDFNFNLIHINPVLSANAKSGSIRSLVDGIKSLPISDYNFLETELMLTRMIDNPSEIKEQLINKYNKLLN